MIRNVLGQYRETQYTINNGNNGNRSNNNGNRSHNNGNRSHNNGNRSNNNGNRSNNNGLEKPVGKPRLQRPRTHR